MARPRASNAVGRMMRGNVVVAALLMALLLFGGASRADAFSQAWERVIAITLMAAVFWNSHEKRMRDCRVLLWLLGAWTALIATQLIPLPPGLWSALPGRDLPAGFYRIMGGPLPWRPLTLEPAATTNSLLAMLVPWAALLLMTVRLRRDELLIELLLIAFIILSLAVGSLQMVSGGHSFYLYTITNLGSPVGLFSNRNHNAFMIAMLVPLLTHVLLKRSQYQELPLPSLLVLYGVAFAALINILVIGSRMGLALFVLGAIASWALLRVGAKGAERPRRRILGAGAKYWIAGGSIAAVSVLAIILVLYGDQFTTLWRVSNTSGEEDRLKYLPWVVELCAKYFPTGSGFGTFPAVFEIVEPEALLQLSYLNHAHNDLVEIGVEGGLVAAILALIFGALWVVRSVSVWTRRPSNENDGWPDQARLGSVLTGMLLMASATDYPLRTPACSVTFVIACYWLFREKPEPMAGPTAAK